MSTTYFWDGIIPRLIAKSTDSGVVYWNEKPAEVSAQVQNLGPASVVIDGQGHAMSADDFWDAMGVLRWDVSGIGKGFLSQAATS